MSRSPRYLSLGLVVLGLLAAHAVGAEPEKKEEPPAAQAQAGVTYSPWGSADMGYFYLSTPAFQKDLKLSDEQKQKLKEINEKNVKETQQAWADWQQAPKEKQPEKMAEINAASVKRNAEARKETQALLTPEQADQLKRMSFRMGLQMALYNPQAADQLGFTAEQKQKLQQMRDEALEKQWQMQQEMAEKTLQLLTPDQRKKYEELIAKPATAK